MLFKEPTVNSISIPAKLKDKQGFCILIMYTAVHSKNAAETYSNSLKFDSYKSRVIILFCWVFLLVIHYDIPWKTMENTDAHQRVESSIQMYSETTKPDPALHLQESLMDYLNPSNRAISCHSENKRWPPVLHLFVMADLQVGMIYLKIRTSREIQEVSSAFQSDHMNKVTVNFGHDKIVESLEVCGQTGNCPAQPVFFQIQKWRMNLTESLEKLGIIKATSEMNRTAQILRTDSSVRENTTWPWPHQTQGSFDKEGSG